MTRRLAIIASIMPIIGICFLLQSCDSGSGDEGILDCIFVCEKNEQCCRQDPMCDPWDDFRRQECMYDCYEWNKTYTDEFLEGYEECIKLPCASDEAIQCSEELMASCEDPPATKVESICMKRLECFFDDTMEECTYFWGNLMVCFSEKAVDAVESCTLNSNCDTFKEDYGTCLEDELGLKPQQ